MSVGQIIQRTIPWLVAGLLIGSFIRLGLWQLNRAEQKEAIAAAIEVGQQGAPIRMQRYSQVDDYTPVRLDGQFDERAILLDNQIVESMRGVHVYMPFLPADGGPAVLVNRGWRQLGVTQQINLEALRTPVEVSGLMRSPPRVGMRLGEVNLISTQWPQSLPYLDMTAIETALGLPLAEQILLLTDEADDGLLRDWQLKTMPPAKHLAYALQWFTMAGAVFILALVVHFSSRRRRLRQSQE